jgi:hypothetical protein
MLAAAVTRGATAAQDQITFKMVPSAAAAASGCLPAARGDVTLTRTGRLEDMQVQLTGLPGGTMFDLFATQVPDAPFGVSWLLGQIKTTSGGDGKLELVGQFSKNTFMVAPGTATAPAVDEIDAASNPATAPVHVFHLGLWFDSSADATSAGCSGAVTPFNGTHTAGVQALSTRQIAADRGPLQRIGR